MLTRAPSWQKVGTLEPPVGYDSLISVSVGPTGEAVSMWASPSAAPESPDLDLHERWVTFGPSRPPSSRRVAIARYERESPAPQSVVIVEHVPIWHRLIQPLSDGSSVLVGARCQRFKDGSAERNAIVVDTTGSVVGEGTLGDGIAHVLVDDQDSIWVGYFDEGVFGNDGWHAPGVTPLGASGLVRWARGLEKEWEFPGDPKTHIADCYSLNVADGVTWACTYTGFPLLEIRNDSVKVHETKNVAGPRGVVVADRSIAFLGRWGDSDAALVGSIDDLQALRPETIVAPKGREGAARSVVCRGSVAHMFVDADWHVLDLGDAV